MKIKCLPFLVLLLISFLGSVHADFACGQDYGTRSQEFLKADAVFLGKAMGVRLVESTPSGTNEYPLFPIEYYAARFQVVKSFKGYLGKEVIVTSEVSYEPGDIGTIFKEGGLYLIYSNKENCSRFLIPPGNLTERTEGCARADDVSHCMAAWGFPDIPEKRENCTQSGYFTHACTRTHGITCFVDYKGKIDPAYVKVCMNGTERSWSGFHPCTPDEEKGITDVIKSPHPASYGEQVSIYFKGGFYAYPDDLKELEELENLENMQTENDAAIVKTLVSPNPTPTTQKTDDVVTTTTLPFKKTAAAPPKTENNYLIEGAMVLVLAASVGMFAIRRRKK